VKGSPFQHQQACIIMQASSANSVLLTKLSKFFTHSQLETCIILLIKQPQTSSIRSQPNSQISLVQTTQNHKLNINSINHFKDKFTQSIHHLSSSYNSHLINHSIIKFKTNFPTHFPLLGILELYITQNLLTIYTYIRSKT